MDTSIPLQSIRVLEGLPKHPQAVLPFLQSSHDATRRKAIAALGRIGGHPEVVPALLECLGDTAPRNRLLAMKALGDLKSREALGALTDRLADADRRTVLTAMTALKRIGDLPASTITALEAFRMHPDAEVRKRAVEALKT